MDNKWLIKNSIKQMLRMPLKTVSFFVLTAATGFLLSLAAGMFVKTTANAKSYRQIFKTIGTVTQLSSSMDRRLTWDAGIQDYKISRVPEYESYITEDSLDFEGACYVIPPAKRSYYASYSPEYKIAFSGELSYSRAPVMNPVVEFSPEEDCVPDHAVFIHVTRVLFGHTAFDSRGFWFCDHNDPDPQMLYKDRTYIARISEKYFAHGDDVEAVVPKERMRITKEYCPEPLSLNMYDGSGKSLIEDEETFQPYYEVTDGFYETPVGKKYLNLAGALDLMLNTFPVTGTDSTDLLLPFYNGNVFISEGRDISKEAYENGLHECLVSKIFAENNGLYIGDSVTANLLFTNSDKPAEENYRSWGGGIFDFSMLMKDGKVPQVFETEDYTIVGIYDSAAYGDDDPMYRFGSDEMIVPLKSIKTRDKNILAYGPMNEYTTSFRIPNGSIDEYTEKWEAQGINDIKLTFYDMGYMKLKKGMENMRFMSIIFGAAGITAGAVLLVFYSRMFVGGQKVRITIERCMGIKARECSRSLLAGAMLVLFIGSAAGCFLGTIAAGSMSLYDMGRKIYDTTYTVGHTAEMSDIALQALSFKTTFLTGTACTLFIIAAGYLILRRDIRSLLRQEPLYLADSINRE